MVWFTLGFLSALFIVLVRGTAKHNPEVRIVQAWRKPTDDKVEMSADRLRRFTGHG